MKNKFSLLLLTLSSCVVANDNFIEIGAGYIDVRDNFTYIDVKKHRGLKNFPLDQEIVVPVFNLNYNGFFIGAGENREGIGYRYDFGELSVEVSIDSYEVFENPYLENQDRKLIDAQEMGISILSSYSNFLEYSLGYKHIKVDDKVAKDLRQSANQIDFDAEAILLPIGKSSYFGLGYHFTYHDSKGESNSYIKNGISIFNITEFAQDYEFVSSVMYADYNFDKKNSYFGKIREEEELIVSANLRVNNIFNSQKLYFQTGLFYNSIGPNIDFFEREYAGGSVSIGYKF